MKLIQINRNPSRSQLAVFGAIWLVFFGVVGAIVLREIGSIGTTTAFWAAAVLVPAIGCVVPGFLRIVNVSMAYAVFPIGLVVSSTILAIVYYVVLTPIGVIMRLFRYDPMNRRFDSGADTYWHPREQDDRLNRCFRQF